MALHVTAHPEHRGAPADQAPGTAPSHRARRRPGGRDGRGAVALATRVALAYLAFAVSWVVVSDQVVRALFRDPSPLTLAQTLKGTAFVSGSALLLYVLVRRGLKERERARLELARAEASYRTLVEQIPAITYVAAAGEGGPTLYVSPQAERLLGYPARAWTANPRFRQEHLHPEDREAALAWWSKLRGGGASVPALEYRMVASDGRVVWFRDHARLLALPEGGGLIHGVMLDVTEEKAARERCLRNEEELRREREVLRRIDEERRRLLASLVGAEERERRRIASDVHDGPVQKLAAVGIRLSALRDRLADPGERGALEETLAAVGEATASLRHLLFELRPASLDRDGLVSALREHLEHLSREAGFRWRVENALGEEPPPEARRVAFRVALEALANVRKHARAREVVVRLGPREGGIGLVVQDDGVGFDPAAVGEASDHFGLVEMRERAELAGGWLEIKSAPGAGTRVACFLPTRRA